MIFLEVFSAPSHNVIIRAKDKQSNTNWLKQNWKLLANGIEKSKCASWTAWSMLKGCQQDLRSLIPSLFILTPFSDKLCSWDLSTAAAAAQRFLKCKFRISAPEVQVVWLALTGPCAYLWTNPCSQGRACSAFSGFVWVTYSTSGQRGSWSQIQKMHIDHGWEEDGPPEENLFSYQSKSGWALGSKTSTLHYSRLYTFVGEILAWFYFMDTVTIVPDCVHHMLRRRLDTLFPDLLH